MELQEYTDDEYETLRTSEREIAGNEEVVAIDDVVVGGDEVRIALAFDWTDDRETIAFDLDRERDVMELKTLAGALGYEYDQLPYLEGETVTAVYLDGQWVPAPTLPDAGPATLSDASADGPNAAVGAYKRLRCRLGEVTAKQAVLAVVLGKKLLIVGALVYLIVT